MREVKYLQNNLGLGLSDRKRNIFQSEQKGSRVLAYSRPFQIAVTFEIDLTHYELIRMEVSYLDWLSAVGGLSSIIFAAS